MAKKNKNTSSFGFGSNTKLQQKNSNKEKRLERRAIRVKKAKDSNALRYRNRAVFNSTFGGLTLLIGIILTFVLVRTMVNTDFEFTIIGFLNSLKSMPYISVQDILSWELGFPDWLEWAESLITVVSFLGACLYNMIATIVWFLRFLFVG